ncbi:hypothetical protein B0H13DRAFT_1898978 [Mycena leptocephala]|nr:hypothetical protein B0H13DRAFT_1898978 [Mycena leptocephala]
MAVRARVRNEPPDRVGARDSAAVQRPERERRPDSPGLPNFQKGKTRAGAYSASLSAALAHAANWGGRGQCVGPAGVLSDIHIAECRRAPLRAGIAYDSWGDKRCRHGGRGAGRRADQRGGGHLWLSVRATQRREDVENQESYVRSGSQKPKNDAGNSN